MDRHIASIAELAQVIQEDLLSEAGEDRRYPWRWVFTPTLWGLAPVVTSIGMGLSNDVRVVDVGSLQSNPESVITTDDILELIRKCDKVGGSFVITGVSEVLRFGSNERFEALVQGISQIENHGEDRMRRRFYIPIAGLHERFQQLVWNKAQRERSKLWPANWVVDEQIGSEVQVLLLGEPLDVTAPKVIESYAQFNSLWNGTQLRSAIVTSDTVASLYDLAPKDVFPDAAVSIRRVSGYDEYLRTQLGVDIAVPYQAQHSGLWRTLVEEIQSADEPRLRSVLCKQLDVAKLELSTALCHWPNRASDEYHRWLIRVGVCTLFPESYLAHCLSGLEALDSTALATSLLSNSIRDCQQRTPERLEERRTHLRALCRSGGPELQMPVDLQEELRNMAATDRLSLLTDTTAWERCQFVLLFADESVSRESWFRAVQQAFPVLYDYIEPYRFEGLPEGLAWANEYFDSYRESRLLDQPNESLKSSLAKVNSDEDSFFRWYYAGRTHDAASLLNGGGGQALMVDGMGWEWAPFIVRRLHHLGLEPEQLMPTAARLPTTTEFNRFGPQVVPTSSSPDAIAHGAPYQYPRTLIEELEVMRTLVDEELAKPGTAVVADHGLTAFSRSVGGISKYHMEGVEHEGRCAWLKEHKKACMDFVVYDVPAEAGLPSGPVALALGYTPLGSMGTHLAHGGATPEEVLVPTFIVRALSRQQQYSITRSVATDAGTTSRQIVFEVKPEPISAPKASLAKKEISVVHLPSGLWAARLPSDLVGGSVFVDIQVETTTVTFLVNLKAGMVDHSKELFE